MRTAQKNYRKTPREQFELKKKYLIEANLKESFVDKHLNMKRNPYAN